MSDARPPAGSTDWVPGHEHRERWRRCLALSPRQRLPGLSCTALGVQDVRTPGVGPRVPEHDAALVLLSGSGWFSRGGGERMTVAAPALLWLVPGVVHRYEPDAPGWTEGFAAFTGPAVAACARRGLIDPDESVVPLTSAEPARLALRKLATVCNEAEPNFDASVAAGLHELLATLRRCRVTPAAGRLTVLEELGRAAHLPISVLEHARRLSLTLAELRDEVRHTAGCSPKDFILGTRLNAAKDLLAVSDLKVASIARRIGYGDPGYFTRVFTRRVGMSPGTFRKRHAPRT